MIEIVIGMVSPVAHARRTITQLTLLCRACVCSTGPAGPEAPVCYRARGRAGEVWLADGPFARADEQQLQASVWSTLDSSLRGNASAGTSRFSMRISLEAETNRRHAHTLLSVRGRPEHVMCTSVCIGALIPYSLL